MYPFLKLLMVVDDQFKIKVAVENYDTTLISGENYSKFDGL